MDFNRLLVLFVETELYEQMSLTVYMAIGLTFRTLQS